MNPTTIDVGFTLTDAAPYAQGMSEADADAHLNAWALYCSVAPAIDFQVTDEATREVTLSCDRLPANSRVFIDWGDGQTIGPTPLAGQTFQVPHTYPFDGTWRVSVSWRPPDTPFDITKHPNSPGAFSSEVAINWPPY